jgi:hypothetical protein
MIVPLRVGTTSRESGGGREVEYEEAGECEDQQEFGTAHQARETGFHGASPGQVARTLAVERCSLCRMMAEGCAIACDLCHSENNKLNIPPI